MTPFTTIKAVAAPMPIANIDTDQIIPARYLSKSRPDQKDGMFRDMRYHADGTPRPEFVLNQAPFRKAQIIVAERNFACGSSRENAVTSMLDNGLKVFIAPSFGDIFFNNCFQNGCLPIVLPEARVSQLLRFLLELPGAEIAVDLAAQTVTGPDGRVDTFEVDPFRKECLLQGLDDVTLTLQHAAEITAFEVRHKADQPWL